MTQNQDRDGYTVAEDPETVWIGRTEMQELLEDGETVIRGEQYKLTVGAKAVIPRD